MKLKREYLRLLEKAIRALEGAVDSFNSVHQPYRNETTLILMTNAWELLSKAVLVRAHKSIAGDRPGTTISAEVAVSRLRHERILDENQEDCIQQVVSLRNAAVHHLLPDVPAEVMHHLLFFCCKFFRDVTQRYFARMRRNSRTIFFRCPSQLSPHTPTRFRNSSPEYAKASTTKRWCGYWSVVSGSTVPPT